MKHTLMFVFAAIIGKRDLLSLLSTCEKTGRISWPSEGIIALISEHCFRWAQLLCVDPCQTCKAVIVNPLKFSVPHHSFCCKLCCNRPAVNFITCIPTVFPFVPASPKTAILCFHRVDVRSSLPIPWTYKFFTSPSNIEGFVLASLTKIHITNKCAFCV